MTEFLNGLDNDRFMRLFLLIIAVALVFASISDSIIAIATGKAPPDEDDDKPAVQSATK